MKELKKPRRKAIPHCYQKRSRSNTSLSQLVHIASYKKRINDLSRNNRRLAVALQECRIEMALQNNLLKDYAGDRNQILFARLKLNEMAKDVAKFVSDLEEVRNYLNINLPTFAQKNGSPNERIIKAPTVNCIEEVSIVASDNEISSSEVVPDVNKMSDPMPFHQPEENGAEVQPSTSRNSPDLTINVEAPILFVDGSEEKNKKSSSRSKRSKTSNIAEGSLTPELDIDLTYSKRKRTSSRRMTQFSFEPRSSKSREKSASEKKSSSEEELVTPEIPMSPPEMNINRNPVKADRIQKEISRSPFIENIQERQNKSLSDHSEGVHNIDDPHLNNSSEAPVVVETVLPCIKEIENNHTLLTCEDMELTEVIRPDNQIAVVHELPDLVEPPGDSELYADVPGETMQQDKDDSEIDSEVKSCKLSDYPQTSAAMSDDARIPEVKNIDSEDEILNVGELTFCEPNVDNESDDSFSPVIRRSRPKKFGQYAVFFSSDESEKESPAKPVLNKRKNNKSKNETTNLVHEKISQKTTEEKNAEVTQDCFTRYKILSGVENKVSKDDLAVYNLDVSNSEKPAHNKQRKKIKTSKGKKGHIQELPKPLLQNCSVTKLKAGNYKFSKSKISSEKLRDFKSLASGKSPVSPSSILKKSQCDPSQNNVEEIKSPLSRDSCRDNVEGNQLCTSIIHSRLRDVLETPKSESKRVSFAPTDLVCNFKRMSVSKKISDNKKVRRTSKSALEFEDLLEETNEERADCHLDSNVSSRSQAVKKLDLPDFNFSDNTELYTFTSLPNSHAPEILTDDLCQPLKLAISENVNQTKTIIDNSKRVHIILKSPKQTGKLSLKKNKVVQKEVCSFSEVEKETDVLLAESPKAVVIKAKRKSLFKELLEEDFKENTCPDEQPSEKLDNVLLSKPLKATHSLLASVKIHKKKSLATNKRLSKASSKNSLKRNTLSDKHKLPQVTPEEKHKRNNLQANPPEASPILKDVLNVTVAEDVILPKRRSKPVSYMEPKLNKKLRRE